jgi:hypothetical protein
MLLDLDYLLEIYFFIYVFILLILEVNFNLFYLYNSNFIKLKHFCFIINKEFNFKVAKLIFYLTKGLKINIFIKDNPKTCFSLFHFKPIFSL